MARRQSWGERIARDAKLAMRDAAVALEQAKADATARGRTLIRDIEENVSAGAARFGENLAASQQIQREAVRAIVPPPRASPAATPRAKAAPAKSPTVSQKAGAKPGGAAIPSAAGRIAAATNALVDTATLDAVDHVAAIQRAVRGMGPTSDVFENYRWWVTQSEAEDAEYARLYPNTDRAAQIAGTVVPILLSGGASLAPQGFVRLAPLAVKSSGIGVRALAQRFGPQAAIAGLGGSASAGTQVVIDVINPNRPVNAADTAAAFAGGASGALATLYGSPRVGAVTEAATTELARSALSGEPVSWDAIQDGAIAGSYAGRLAGGAGAKWSNELPSFKGSIRKGAKRGPFRSKEELGDFLGESLSRLRLEGVSARQKNFKVSGGNTRVDHVTDEGFLRENKFGFGVNHSRRQREATLELLNYRTHHFTPDDIGKGIGGAAALLMAQLSSRPDDSPAP
jgi:hypothetical protein